MSDKFQNSLKGKNGGLFPLALALGGMASGLLYMKIQKDKKSEELRKKAAGESSKSKLPKIDVGASNVDGESKKD